MHRGALLVSVNTHLKVNKSRDPHGLIFELYKENTAGDDLLDSLLILLNTIKKTKQIPDFLIYGNITSIYKNKGELSDLINERGIFNLVTIRTILDKLIYQDNYEKINSNMSDSNIGARKQRNIRDHLFVLNGVINNVIKNKQESIDILIYDISQCFDSMWYRKTMTDLFDVEVQNDHYALLCELNKKSLISIKTPVGITSREQFNEIIMQGGVWGPLKCSVQIDDIGKECVKTGKYIYKYKESVDIPPLAMIDDVAAITKCGIDSVQINSYINTKIKSNKLKFGPTKCVKLHVKGGKKDCECLSVSVENTEMKSVEHVKYLGDEESNDGRNDINIEKRCTKGIGIKSQIIPLVKKISLGSHYFDIGLLLRDTNLINGILFNSEVWYGMLQKHVEKLEKIDELFLRSLLDAHSKTAIEALYLETGKMPISFLLQKRRLMYWHHLVKRDKNSLLQKFYNAQKNGPVNGDWVNQLEKDKKDFNINYSDDELKLISKAKFKKEVKLKANKVAIGYFNILKAKHSKTKNIKIELKPSDYLKDKRIHPDNAKFIFKIRTRMYAVKANFKNQFKKSYLCDLCKLEDETQEHLMKCKVLKESIPELKITNIKYIDIFGSIEKIIPAAKLLYKVCKERESLLNLIENSGD